VPSLQVESSAAGAGPAITEVADAIVATRKPNAQAWAKEFFMMFVNLVFIVVASSFVFGFRWPLSGEATSGRSFFPLQI
jgi:hypothetical protein